LRPVVECKTVARVVCRTCLELPVSTGLKSAAGRKVARGDDFFLKSQETIATGSL
jgi:hypothetical protein